MSFIDGWSNYQLAGDNLVFTDPITSLILELRAGKIRGKTGLFWVWEYECGEVEELEMMGGGHFRLSNLNDPRKTYLNKRRKVRILELLGIEEVVKKGIWKNLRTEEIITSIYQLKGNFGNWVWECTYEKR